MPRSNERADNPDGLNPELDVLGLDEPPGQERAGDEEHERYRELSHDEGLDRY